MRCIESRRLTGSCPHVCRRLPVALSGCSMALMLTSVEISRPLLSHWRWWSDNLTMSAYALAVASGGPKLQKSAIAEKDCTFDTGPDACHNFVGGLGHSLNAKAIDNGCHA